MSYYPGKFNCSELNHLVLQSDPLYSYYAFCLNILLSDVNISMSSFFWLVFAKHMLFTFTYIFFIPFYIPLWNKHFTRVILKRISVCNKQYYWYWFLIWFLSGQISELCHEHSLKSVETCRVAKSFVSFHECSIYRVKRMCSQKKKKKRMCSPTVNCVQNLYTLSDFFFTYSFCIEQRDGDLCISLCLCQLLLYLNLIIRYRCAYFYY